MTKAEIYYRQVNSLPIEEFLILGVDDRRIIELMNDFAQEEVKLFSLPNVKKAERPVCIYSGSCFCRREDGTCGIDDLCQFKD